VDVPVYAASLPFRTVALDGLTAIYHRASGATHVVAEPIPQLLATFGDQAFTTDQLLTRLRDDYDINDDQALTALVARLDELIALGLVTKR
jgi:PqqD family protein of HPr-rel-A system